MMTRASAAYQVAVTVRTKSASLDLSADFAPLGKAQMAR
jgi:hypothetical protein